MNINFNMSEFNISGSDIPEDVADKLLKYHIAPMQTVRNLFKKPIYPSEKSGYRPLSWELAKGRSGNSQHTFAYKGAVDWTCNDFSDNKEELLKLIIENTNYKRIAVYNTFIHCDYKGDKRQLFNSDLSSSWTFVKFL